MGFEGKKRAFYLSLIPLGILAIWLSRFSLLYPVVIAVVIVAVATAAANLTPDLYDRINFGPRALMVSDGRLELVRLPRPDQPPDLLATFERNSVVVESIGNGPAPGTVIGIRDKDGRPLAMLRNCRPYGPDGSRRSEPLLATRLT